MRQLHEDTLCSSPTQALRAVCSMQAFQYSVDDFVDRYKGKGIEAVVGAHVAASAVSPALPA